jgi:hypothetical protein
MRLWDLPSRFIVRLIASCTGMDPQFMAAWGGIHVRSPPENMYIASVDRPHAGSPAQMITAAMKKLEADVHFVHPSLATYSDVATSVHVLASSDTPQCGPQRGQHMLQMLTQVMLQPNNWLTCAIPTIQSCSLAAPKLRQAHRVESVAGMVLEGHWYFSSRSH